MYTTYVLFVIWSNYYKGGLGIIQQEFYTGKECELAKNALVAAPTVNGVKIVTYGCFKK
jgi:hypothetical protein